MSGNRITEILKKKILLFIKDYYDQFGDNQVIVAADGLSWEYFEIYNGISSLGGVKVNPITTEVDLWSDDFDNGFSVQMQFEGWNNYIAYIERIHPKQYSDLMHWDDYLLKITVNMDEKNNITDMSIN